VFVPESVSVPAPVLLMPAPIVMLPVTVSEEAPVPSIIDALIEKHKAAVPIWRLPTQQRVLRVWHLQLKASVHAASRRARSSRSFLRASQTAKRSAVAGEAAAIGMGLIMLGSGDQKAIEEMLGYAHDTQHEKIIRGLALALGMTMYGREEESDALVSTLLHDADPILRYGAMYTIAFAFACSGSNSALRRLLRAAVDPTALPAIRSRRNRSISARSCSEARLTNG
jgi:hypothetical protein